MELPYNVVMKKYDKPATPEYYNKFFNPNICHVCKKKLETNWKVCYCRMIFYCSDEHKKIHREQHYDLCNAIFRVNGHNVLWGTLWMNMDQWVDAKKTLIEYVQEELKRILEPYEEQMFLFVKSCFVCHKQPEQKESVCKKCYCVNYCKDHQETFFAHKIFCSQLQLSLCLDLSIIGLDSPNIDFIENFPDSNKHLCDMIEFIKQYVYGPDQDTWFTREFVFTDYVSGPLTVFYGIKEVQMISNTPTKMKCFTIHIIVAESKDMLNLPAWELLLHLLKFPLKLIIIMVGPKLDKETEISIYDNVCEICAKEPSKLQFEFYPLLYNDYVNSESYKQPNLIVGFHVKFDDNWWKSIRLIRIQNCPLLLTAKSQSLMISNANHINKHLGQVVKVFYKAVNKFRGYIPHRDFDTENVYFLNEHLTIYKNLNEKYAE